MIKQVNRYDSEFGGPGAIVYKLGHSRALAEQIPGTLLLDRGPLNVTSLQLGGTSDGGSRTGRGGSGSGSGNGRVQDEDGQPLMFETIDGVQFM